MTNRNTKIRGNQVHDDTLTPAKMKALNGAVDGYILEYDETSGDFQWIPSLSGSTETPSGTVNGSNKVFTLSTTPDTGSLSLYLNGLRQEEGSGNDYTLTGVTIVFTEAPQIGDIIIASFLSGSAGAGGYGAGAGLEVNVDVLDVNVDDVTVEIGSGNILRVKADGIGATELDETDSYDFSSGSLKVGTPSAGTDATNKTYVDGLINGLSYTEAFDNTDLTSDKITINHALGITYPQVIVYDNSNLQIIPSEVKYVDSNNIELDFTGMTPLTGTYNVRVSD